MKTIAYVDGYNFYHGRLKHTAYKWLDLRAMIESVLLVQDPATDLVGVKFFTANIKARLARKGEESVAAQSNYHRALTIKGVEVVLGKFSLEPGSAPRFVAGVQANRDDRSPIWVLGEKRTDVQLALAMYRDAAAQRCEQIVLVTNDSDLAPALQAIREDHPSMRIGVVLPRPPTAGKVVRLSASLENLADWTRHHLLDDELAKNQLSAKVLTTKKPIHKPAHW